MIKSADKHGFYSVGDLKTYSKVEAIEWQTRTGHFPQWNFNREVFDNVNWTIEPDIDLWTLYKQRAQQIRDSYDYCVLFYSGGSDSDNMLQAWQDQGCSIDEVASFWNYEATKDANSFMCEEVNKVVLPRMKTLDCKHRLLDVSQLTIDFLAKNKFDYPYYSNHSLSPNNIVKGMFRETVKDWQDIITQGKSLCFVWGFEKPQLGYDEKGTYVQFVDTMDNCVGPYSQLNYANGWYDELFYWTPDMPEIVSKQAHTIQRFVETCDMPKFYKPSSSPYGYNNTLKQWLTHDAVKQIIYPRWDISTFTNGKSPTGAKNYLIYSPRDSWLWNANIKERETMQTIISQTTDKLGKYWVSDGTGFGLYKGNIQKHYIRKNNV